MPILLDPSISSSNIGDQIIRQKVDNALKSLLPVTASLPTQVALTRAQRNTARGARLAIIGGTNLLSSNMPWYQQWKLDPASIAALRNKVVLLGVGWWQYQDEPNAYTRWVLNQVLSRDYVHSVRDEYTRTRIERLGFRTLNTSCPTMWDLDEVQVGARGRPSTAVITLTDYNRDPIEDQWLVDLVRCHYERVTIWPQSVRDAAYARQLKGDFEVAAPSLASYDSILGGGNVDYIGTRLHGGIRAFDTGAWGLIVAVDNRAIEMGRDTGLPVYARGDRDAIQKAITAREASKINLPHSAIREWRAQFAAPTAT